MFDIQVAAMTLLAFVVGYVVAWFTASASYHHRLETLQVRLLRVEGEKMRAESDYQARFDLISQSMATYAINQNRIARSIEELLPKPSREKSLKCQILESV